MLNTQRVKRSYDHDQMITSAQLKQVFFFPVILHGLLAVRLKIAVHFSHSRYAIVGAYTVHIHIGLRIQFVLLQRPRRW